MPNQFHEKVSHEDQRPDRLNILVVSDTPTFAYRAVQALRQGGYNPHLASLGKPFGLSLTLTAIRTKQLPALSAGSGYGDAALLGELNELCSSWKIDLILPVEVKPAAFIQKYKNALLSPTVPLYPASERNHYTNKWNFFKFLQANQIPAPLTRLINQPDTELAFPAIAKPLAMEDSIGVEKIDTQEQLKSYFERHTPTEPVLIQPYIPGTDYSVGFLAHEGELNAWITHKYPYESRSVRHFVNETDVLDIAREVLSKLKYTGIGVMDFRRDSRDGKVYVLEINCRLGGSNQHYITAGLNLCTL